MDKRKKSICFFPSPQHTWICICGPNRHSVSLSPTLTPLPPLPPPQCWGLLGWRPSQERNELIVTLRLLLLISELSTAADRRCPGSHPSITGPHRQETKQIRVSQTHSPESNRVAWINFRWKKDGAVLFLKQVECSYCYHCLTMINLVKARLYESNNMQSCCWGGMMLLRPSLNPSGRIVHTIFRFQIISILAGCSTWRTEVTDATTGMSSGQKHNSTFVV